MSRTNINALLGLTAGALYAFSVQRNQLTLSEVVLLALLISVGTFSVYHQPNGITSLLSKDPRKAGIGPTLLAPALAIVLLIPIFQSTSFLQTMSHLTLPVILTVAYYRPFQIGHRIINGLRAIPLVKNVTIGLAWGLATTPILSVTGETIDLFWFRFLFILALSIAIDVRDCATDSVQDTRTLALLIGSRNSNTLASILLLFAAGFAWLRLSPSDATSLQATIIPLHTIITAISVSLLNANSKPMTYFWLIDFQLFLHALLFLTTRIGN